MGSEDGGCAGLIDGSGCVVGVSWGLRRFEALCCELAGLCSCSLVTLLGAARFGCGCADEVFYSC